MSKITLRVCRTGSTDQRIEFADIGVAVDAIYAMVGDDLPLDWEKRLTDGEEVAFQNFTAQIDGDAAVEETAEEADPLIVYQLMRSDVPSFVNGKAMAQAHHCGTAMVLRALDRDDDGATLASIREWAKEADGFGTCITLEVTLPVARQMVSMANLVGLYAEMINDPTYPIKDGDTIKTLPVDTCAFIFGRVSQARAVVRGLNLFP